MRKHFKVTVVSILILLTRSYDAYCTYQLTPDLSKEANPLVSVIGIDSWSLLLIVLGILTAYTLFAYLKSSFRPFNLLPNESGLSFSHFVGYLYTGNREPWYVLLFKFPKNFSRFNEYMGQLMTLCLLYAGAVSTLMWVLIKHSESYKSIHSPALIYSILILGTVLISFIWNLNKYRQYKAQSI